MARAGCTDKERLNELSRSIVDAAFQIHKRIGPGLLESVYESLLARSLVDRALYVERQKIIPLTIDGIQFQEAFRADLIVNRCIVIEVKAVEKLAYVHHAQVLTYLRLLDYRLGLLINFGAPLIKHGIHRIVNSL